MDDAIRAALDATWRDESARIIGALMRVVGDLEAAEEIAQEALVTAMERWPASGVPDNPGAWLTTTARRRAIDVARHRAMRDRKHELLAHRRPAAPEAKLIADLDDDVKDDVLRLMLIACHPVLSKPARVTLTLRLVAGLKTDAIARALLTSESAVAQRVVRAKRTLRAARVPFERPRGALLAASVASVMEVIYLIFNEGYVATAGDALTRPDLCREATRLGLLLAHLLPGAAEIHGLVSLMQLQAARLDARTDDGGAPVLLLDQDRSRWDLRLIQQGLASLDRAESMGGPHLGVYTLQAAIAACHARARTADDTPWDEIVALYDALYQLTRSPVVDLNRAVAVGMAFGPEQGLEHVERLTAEGALSDYHLLPAVHGDLLLKLGRPEEARAHFQRAASMTRNARERELLLSR